MLLKVANTSREHKRTKEVRASLDFDEVTELGGFKVRLMELLKNWGIVSVKYQQLG